MRTFRFLALALSFLTLTVFLPAQGLSGEIPLEPFSLGPDETLDVVMDTRGAEDPSGVILFLGPRGEAWSVKVDSRRTVTSLPWVLIYRHVVRFRISTGAPASGFVIATQSLEHDGPRLPLRAELTLRRSEVPFAKLPLLLIAAPLISRAVLAYDPGQGRTAIAALTLGSNALKLTLLEEDGRPRAPLWAEFTPLDQRLIFLEDHFPAAGNRPGLLQVEGMVPFQLLAFRFHEGQLWVRLPEPSSAPTAPVP